MAQHAVANMQVSPVQSYEANIGFATKKKYNIELSQNSFTEQKPYYPLAKRQLGRHDRA